MVRREFLFNDYRDWFLNNSDKEFSKGKYTGVLRLYQELESYPIGGSGLIEINVFNLHKNMNLIYFEFHRKIAKSTSFFIDIFDEETKIHHRKILEYSKNQNISIEGIFIPIQYLINSCKYGTISMGTNVFLKWKKYMEDVNDLKNKSS